LLASEKSLRNGPFDVDYLGHAHRRQPLLFEYRRSIEELGELILNDLAGRTMGIEEAYESHSVGKPFVLKNYREVLCKLEMDGKISVNTPCPPRRKDTLAKHAIITFPARK
jgi:hypothetical protein